MSHHYRNWGATGLQVEKLKLNESAKSGEDNEDLLSFPVSFLIGMTVIWVFICAVIFTEIESEWSYGNSGTECEGVFESGFHPSHCCINIQIAQKLVILKIKCHFGDLLPQSWDFANFGSIAAL